MTEKNNNKNTSRPAQVTVLLRLAAGAYLIYLSFGLGKETMSVDGERQMLQLGFMVLYFAVGAILSGWSLKKLIKGDYIHPGEDENCEMENGETENEAE